MKQVMIPTEIALAERSKRNHLEIGDSLEDLTRHQRVIRVFLKVISTLTFETEDDR